MGHVRLTLLLACATALVALCAPAIAQAGSYSWSLPGDFSGSANPDQKYGTSSFGYDLGSPSTSLTPLTCSSGACDDGAGDSVSTDGSGHLVMSTAALKFVTVVWTDPLGASLPATVNYSESGCLLQFSVTDQNGSPVSNGQQVNGPVYITSGGTLPCSANVTLTITAATPAVTITAPTNNSTFTTGQPEFAGTASAAFDASSNVTVRVYPGATATGTPVESLTTAESNGTFLAVPTDPLPNGTYTAEAEQDDPVGTTNFSQTVTFTLANSSPSVTLDSLGSKPLVTSTPTFTGTAGTRPEDNKVVGVLIWSGSTISGQPVAAAKGTVDSSGKFSVQSPALADGRYTAVVGQSGDGLIGFSSPMIFRIKVHPPALSMVFPSAGGSMRRTAVFFSGQAGDALGDSSTVSVSLYRGSRVRGKALGKRTVGVNGAGWSLGWGSKLQKGSYTVRAVQTDDAGHTSQITHTFVIVPGPTTLGSFVSLTSSNTASLSVGCVSSSGTCSGTVLVVTKGSFRTSAGGPLGPLRVLFAFVQIPAGRTQTVRASVAPGVARVLRRHRGMSLSVRATLSRTGKVSAIRSLKLGS